MTIYSVAAALRGSLRTREGWMDIFWVLLAFLFLFVAFRYEIGCDWNSYRLNYENYITADYTEAFTSRQPLYASSFVFLHDLSLAYEWFNVLCAAIFFAGIAALARRQVDPLAFLILCFPVLIINMPMSGVRQGVAIGLVCLAFIEFSRERLIRYVMWVVTATLFHSSAIIFLALAPLIKEMSLNKRVVWILVLAIPGAIALASSELVEVANTRYIDSDIEAGGAIFRIAPVTLCGVLWFTLLRREWKERFPRDYKLAIVGSAMMIGVIAVTPVSSVIADRIAYFLMPLQALIFARIPFLNIPWRKTLSVAPYFFLAGLFTAWLLLSNHYDRCYAPYETWLFG